MSNPTIGPEQGVGQSLRGRSWLARRTFMAEKFLHMEAVPADAVRALKLRRGEDRIVKSTEVMIARALESDSSAVIGRLALDAGPVQNSLNIVETGRLCGW